jgi:hypothetical protein
VPWLRPDPTVRPVFGDHRLVGKSPEGSRQPGGDFQLGEGLDPAPGCFVDRGRNGGWRITCGSTVPSVIACARCCRDPDPHEMLQQPGERE